MHRLRADCGPTDAEARVSRLAASLLGDGLDIGGILDAVAAAAREALGADRASLYVVAADLRIAGVHTTETDSLMRARLEALVGLGSDELPHWGAMLAGDDPVLVLPHVGAPPEGDARLAADLGVATALTVRLRTDDRPEDPGEVLGCLAATWRAPHRVDDHERQTAAALGGLAASVLRSARLQAGTADLLEAARTREAALARAQRMARLGGWTWRVADGRIEWSDEAYRVLGLERRAPADLDTFLARVHPGDRETVAAHLRARPGRSRSTCAFVRPDGDVRVIAGSAEADLVDMAGRARLYVGTMQDVTAIERAQEGLALRARLRDAVDAAVIATDLAGTVAHWNRAAERMYGWSRDEAIGRHVVSLTVGPADEALARAVMDSLAREGRWEGEFRVCRRDGTTFPAYVRNLLIRGDEGEAVGMIGVSVDISARVEMEGRLRAARDFLATVTDSMGDGLITLDAAGCVTHLNPAAERMLGWRSAEVAGRHMHDTVHFRRSDGRPYPAEECRLLRPRPDGEVVRGDDEMFVRRDGEHLHVSCTSVPFVSEEHGRGWVVVFSDATERRRREEALRRDLEEAQWTGRIREALAQDDFVLHAQPIIELASARVVRHELPSGCARPTARSCRRAAFCRPPRGTPSSVRSTAGWCAGRRRSPPPVIPWSSTCRPRPSARRASRAWWRRPSRAPGRDPRLVVIELTETALLRREAVAGAFVERMRAIGCGVALDDFGTGYGGLRYLKRLPVDHLKIDVEFVRDLEADAASRHVVEAVVHLARAFGRRTIAEGVERVATLALLEEMGVDMAQGYGIGRPRPIAEAFDPRHVASAERRARRGLRRPD